MIRQFFIYIFQDYKTLIRVPDKEILCVQSKTQQALRGSDSQSRAKCVQTERSTCSAKQRPAGTESSRTGTRE